MSKPQFTYEVKDFEPTIRKKPLGKLTKLIIGLLVCALIFIAGFGIYRHYFGKEKLGPEERVKEAVSDTLSQIAGKESYISKKAELEDWYDTVHEGVFAADLNLKIKDMKDFGIGIESLANGIGLTIKTVNDSAQGLSEGSVYASWTVVALNVLQYVYDGSAFYLSSSDFFKENFRLDPKNTKLLEMSIREIGEKYLGDYLSEEELARISEISISGMSLQELFRQTKPEMQYEELNERGTLTINDKNVECDKYLVTMKEELTGDSAEILLYIDDKDRLLKAQIKAPHVDYIDISFEGEKRSVDRICVKAAAEVGETKHEGDLTITINDSDEKMTMRLDGELRFPDFTSTGVLELNYFYEDSTFTCCFSGTDGAMNIEVSTDGNMTKDKENLKLKFENISLKVDQEEYILLSGSLNLKVSDKKLIPGEHPKENVVDVENINKEVIDGVVEQVKQRIEEYKELIKDFAFIK